MPGTFLTHIVFHRYNQGYPKIELFNTGRAPNVQAHQKTRSFEKQAEFILKPKYKLQMKSRNETKARNYTPSI
jgi:hypothetical protein